MNFIFVYITTKNKEQAVQIGKTLVEEHLAACVNIIDKMTSIYRWEGRVNEDSEAILIVKTRESLFDKLSDRVKSLHSYTCPCIIAFPVIAGNNDYLKWLEAETSAE